MSEHALRWSTRQKLIESPPDVLLVPVGALEQHGPHLPLGTDTIHAEAIAELAVVAARDAGLQIAIAPSVPYGCSDHHLAFGGTLSLSTTTLLAVLRDVIRSAAISGFQRVFLLNGHGGNHELVQVAARDGSIEFGLPVAAGSWWAIAWDDLVAEGAMEGCRLPGHAGGFETAIIGAIRADAVGDLPPKQAELSLTDRRRYEPPYRMERPGRWAASPGYSDDPGALGGTVGRRLLEVAGAAVGAALVTFVLSSKE